MKHILLILFICSTSYMAMAQAPPCNMTLIGTNTTVVSSTMLMDSAASTSAHQNILICGGNTLTYNWVLGKDFFVQNGATLILKSAQIARISLETGATLVFDTVGQVFPGGTIISGITYDSMNVTFVDTNQIYTDTASVYWNNCAGNTFNYTVFSPPMPCTPLAIDNSLKAALNVNFSNPVQHQIVFNSLVLEQASSIKILDMTGKVVRSIVEIERSVDVSFLPQGIYLLQVGAKDGNSVVKKFLKN